MTTDPIRANAFARLEAARSEARRWEEFLHMLDEVAPQTPTATRRGRVQERLPLSKFSNTGALADTAGAVVEIIRSVGRPVSTRELLPALEERGVMVGGKDPISTLSARLSRAEMLENIRGQGWMLRGGAARDEGAGSQPSETPAPSESNLLGAVEGRREVAHDNMT